MEHRSCSLPLQRVVTDLGADLPFAQAADKLQEHYGVALSPSTIRQVTEGHAQALFVDGDDEPAWPTQPGVAIVIAETDGGMVPLVEVDPDSPDRRRGKRSVAVLRMRNGTSQFPLRLTLGDNREAPAAPLRVTAPSGVPCGDGRTLPCPDDEWLDAVSDALCIPPPRLRDLRPLRPSGGTLAPTPSGDYWPSLRSPWPAAVVVAPQASSIYGRARMAEWG